jgi:topoisomerase-4 subunit B
LLDKEVGSESLYTIIHSRTKQIEFAFTHLPGSYGENYFSYVNGQHTNDGGTHQSAFKEGILKGINEYFKKNWAPQDVRDGIVGAIAIKVKDPVFESQTKNKLSNTEIRTWIVTEVKDAIIDFLLKNPEDANKLNQKIINNETLRKELNEVKKGARESAKKVSLNIPKLKDCKYHLAQSASHQDECERSVIFLTEGDSASGTITKTRDVMTQAVFSLRGKILNVFGKKRTEIYKNAELYNMMVALGIENGVEDLRYGKVIIATDADNDGFHIRNLLMTYFLTYFEDLVLAGRLYILETPLFRVRNKQQTVYCYSEKQRDTAIAQIRNSEVTRFKGLGEIDPKEFGQFIGEEIRLVPVSIPGMNEMHKTLEFYMGNNTPQRRDFIMENLI